MLAEASAGATPSVLEFADVIARVDACDREIERVNRMHSPGADCLRPAVRAAPHAILILLSEDLLVDAFLSLANAPRGLQGADRHRLQRRDFCGVRTTHWTAAVRKYRSFTDGMASGHSRTAWRAGQFGSKPGVPVRIGGDRDARDASNRMSPKVKRASSSSTRSALRAGIATSTRARTSGASWDHQRATAARVL